MSSIIGSRIVGYHTQRERTSTRNGDGTRGNVGHSCGMHSNSKQAKANCPICLHPMLECTCDWMPDTWAERSYEWLNSHGGFTLASDGKPCAGRRKRGQCE